MSVALHRSLLVARLLWIFPAILLFLTINQVMVALDLRKTVEAGDVRRAEVIALETTDRVDITMASARLRVPMEDGSTIERELPLPITFVKTLQSEGRDSLDVYMEPGSGGGVVIAEIGRAQWRLAAINGGIAVFGFVLLSWGVFAWNRYLDRKGDPADAVPTT